jgi:hypothetical protein
VSFSSRTVVSSQDFRSPIKQQDAQNRWVEFQKQLVVPKLIEWCKRFCVALSDGNARESERTQLSAHSLYRSLTLGLSLTILSRHVASAALVFQSPEFSLASSDRVKPCCATNPIASKLIF